MKNENVKNFDELHSIFLTLKYLSI